MFVSYIGKVDCCTWCFISDLQRICSKVNKQQYSSVSSFVKDVTKMFDNCRYYNAPNSPFYRCAELLEAFFVQKMKHFKATFEFVI
jgi:nucleosome-remodeling factor subunit BPTF